MLQIYVLALRDFADHGECPHCGLKARYRDGDVMLEGYCCAAGENLKTALAALKTQDEFFAKKAGEVGGHGDIPANNLASDPQIAAWAQQLRDEDQDHEVDNLFGEQQDAYLASLSPGEKPSMQGFLEFRPPTGKDVE